MVEESGTENRSVLISNDEPHSIKYCISVIVMHHVFLFFLYNAGKNVSITVVG